MCFSTQKMNWVVSFDFWWSGQIVSYYVYVVIRAIIMVHTMCISKLTLVPDNCVDHRWKWFKVKCQIFTHMNLILQIYSLIIIYVFTCRVAQVRYMGHILISEFHWMTNQNIKLGKGKQPQIPWQRAQGTYFCVCFTGLGRVRR